MTEKDNNEFIKKMKTKEFMNIIDIIENGDYMKGIPFYMHYLIKDLYFYDGINWYKKIFVDYWVATNEIDKKIKEDLVVMVEKMFGTKKQALIDLLKTQEMQTHIMETLQILCRKA